MDAGASRYYGFQCVWEVFVGAWPKGKARAKPD